MELLQICQNACMAKAEVGQLSTTQKNEALCAIADALVKRSEEIIAANAIDLQKAVENHMAEGLKDRLTLTPARIQGMADGLKQVADLPDPVGEVMETFERPSGIKLEKVRVPFGVIGIIYESRPNVTADAFALCFKAGSAVILKGGSDAINSNMAVTKVIRETLQTSGITPDAICLIDSTDRKVTTEFMQMKEYVDLLIPRGGAGLIRSVVENSSIPVIETGTGNCHIYVDKDADLEKAIPIIMNAKTQRIGVCNACESLVIHDSICDAFLPKLKEALDTKNVEIRGDEKVAEVIDCVPATEEDFGKEYLDYILSMKVVGSVQEAVAHINKYNTGHSDCILTENKDTAKVFTSGVDAACVYVNASTRFTDGFEFGFGAEIGISTQKLHARGPMGLREITTYKFLVTGNGEIRK